MSGVCCETACDQPLLLLPEVILLADGPLEHAGSATNRNDSKANVAVPEFSEPINYFSPFHFTTSTLGSVPASFTIKTIRQLEREFTLTFTYTQRSDHGQHRDGS